MNPMAETLRRICTACPRGCELSIVRASPGETGETGETGEITVTGNQCRKGDEYGRQEAIRPMRILTTTVRTSDRSRPRLPVRTSAAVPLSEIRSLLRAIDAITVEPGLTCGSIVAANLAGCGANLIATDEF